METALTMTWREVEYLPMQQGNHFSDKELAELAASACRKFRGQLPELESAVGCLFIAQMYGWRVVHLVHSQKTVRKYEGLIAAAYPGFKFQSLFRAEGELAHRSFGLKAAKKLKDFWSAVRGTEAVEGKAEVG